MKRANKKTSGLYLYLEPFLATGTEKDIATAKEHYWKEYKKKYNKEKYKDSKCFKILFDASELKILAKAAKQHETSRTAFIKNAALSQGGQDALVDKAIVARVREVLVLHYSAVEELLEEQEDTPIFTDYLLHIITQLQESVLNILNK